jgi:hypothetical protein
MRRGKEQHGLMSGCRGEAQKSRIPTATSIREPQECIEYCAKHGEDRRQMIKVGRQGDRDIELGWDWQMQDSKDSPS